MKPSFLAAAVLALWPCFSLSGRAEVILQPNDTIAICGDSITHMLQYSVFVEDYLLMCQPIAGLRVSEFGWTGEKASGFAKRLKNDVLPFKPTVVTICYGMNDGTYVPITPEIAGSYRQNLEQCITMLKEGGVRTGVVASPGAVDDNFRADNPPFYNNTLAALRDVAKDIAGKHQMAFADLHACMEETMAKGKTAYGKDYLFAGGAPDGVHPAPPGHLTMAYGILKAFGFDGAIGTLELDLTTQKAVATEGNKILSFKDGTLEVESSRYPFCFTPAGVKPSARKGVVPILPFLPFNQDLNRYILIVKGLKGPSAKVTWGSESKEFSAPDLEKGINLAAEFLQNPFCDAFFKVSEAVHAQQAAEDKDMKQVMNPLLKEHDAAKKEQVVKETVAASQSRIDAVRALVVPVRHTLKIETN